MCQSKYDEFSQLGFEAIYFLTIILTKLTVLLVVSFNGLYFLVIIFDCAFNYGHQIQNIKQFPKGNPFNVFEMQTETYIRAQKLPMRIFAFGQLLCDFLRKLKGLPRYPGFWNMREPQKYANLPGKLRSIAFIFLPFQYFMFPSEVLHFCQ